MQTLILIPARYASTRFPAKPLAMLDGRPIIQHVYERVRQFTTAVYVATDDERIASCVEAFGGKYVLTSPDHPSGTDRCREALDKVEAATGQHFDCVVNVQGDEPFIAVSQLQTLVALFDAPATDIATLARPFTPADGIEGLRNPNSPKVVMAADGQALYFSRSVVPYLRGVDEQEWLTRHTYYKHIGLYGYRADVLRQITQLEPSPLEQTEKLEQLRWLESGYTIRVGLTDVETIGIDTPADLLAAEEFIKQNQRR